MSRSKTSVLVVEDDSAVRSLITTALMIFLDDHQTCQLTMSTGKGLQREGIQACQLAE